ncbi:MAG: SpoIIE family protein phosphatase [Planctomycetota bacterium]|jgi:CheY-like chemotaxis protein
MNRLLLIEGPGQGLRAGLRQEGFDVVVADDGASGLDAAAAGRFDVILLDATHGLDVLKRLRARGDATPVILLAAGGANGERIPGLDLGADDCVRAPFGLAELVARIRVRVAAAHRVAVLSAAIAETVRHGDLHGILEGLLATTRALTGAERGLVLLAADDGSFRTLASHGCEADARYCTTVVRHVFTCGEAAAMLGTDGDWQPGSGSSAVDLRLRRVLCAPLVGRGRVVGVLYADSRVRVQGFGRADVALFASLAAQCGLAVEKARAWRETRRLERELHAAGTVQRAMLPPPQVSGTAVEIAGLSRPCVEAGGDYFDYIPRGAHRLALAMGDAAGHGVAAALCMSAARSLVRTFLPRVDDLAAVLTEVNGGLARDMTHGTFMSLFLGELDTGTGALRYASAGHGAALLYRASAEAFRELEPTGAALGLLKESPYELARLRPLAPGDILLLFTDGVPEAMNAARELFGLARLKACVTRLRRAPAPEILHAVEEAVTRFTGGVAPSDDASLMVVKGTAGYRLAG